MTLNILNCKLVESIYIFAKVKVGITQGLETNGISWNTAIRCNNNNGRFIFNPAQTHHSTMSDFELDLESDHVVYK